LRDTDDDTTNSRDEMIRSLFGLSDEAISVWPGLYAVCDQMEESFRELVAGGDALDLGVINRLVPGSRDNCWQFCKAVIRAVGELQEGEASLEKIYQMLVRHSRPGEVDPSEKHQVITCIFASLCWTSMVLRPILAQSSSNTT